MNERPIKVAIAGETIPYIEGGLGYFLFNAIQKLAVAKPDWQFNVIGSSTFKQLAQIQLSNVNIIFWDEKLIRKATIRILQTLFLGRYIPTVNSIVGYIPSKYLRSKWGDLEELWESMNFVDIIWAPHFTIQLNYLSLKKNLSSVNVPILLTIHDIHPVFFPDDWPQDFLDRFWNEFVPFAKRSKCIITHSQFQREGIIKHLGIEPNKVLVTPIPPLIEPKFLFQEHEKKEIEVTLSKYQISLPFVLYPASNTHTHKNHTRLISAWSKIKKRYGDKCPTLVCTAKGHLWHALNELIENLDLQDKVTFTDTIDTKTLSLLYQNCCLVVVPTLYEGGGSGPVAEACFMGKPLICSNIQPIKEQMFSYGCTVTTFDPNSEEAIVQAVEHALETMSDLGIQAKNNQKQLLANLPKMWEEWVRFYTEQIKNLVFLRE